MVNIDGYNKVKEIEEKINKEGLDTVYKNIINNLVFKEIDFYKNFILK